MDPNASESADLPAVSCDDDWLELADGEEGVLRARLESIGRDRTLLMTWPDWSQVVVSVPEGAMEEIGLDRLRREAIGRSVRMVVTRNEDGVHAEGAALVAAEVS
jgi:hypothetical protein